MHNIYNLQLYNILFSRVMDWWSKHLFFQPRAPEGLLTVFKTMKERWRALSGICCFPLIFIFFVLMALLIKVSSLRFMFQCGQKTLNSAGIETGYFFDCYILTILDFSTFTSKKLDPKCILCTICWNQNSSDHVRSYWLAKEEGREEGKEGEKKRQETKNR